MGIRSNRVAERGTPAEQSAAVNAGFSDLNRRVRDVESGRNRGPGSSFGLPFTLVGSTGNWTIDTNGGGSLIVTGPLGTVTVLAAP